MDIENRKHLPDEVRSDWLEDHDYFLMNQLKILFGEDLFIRGRVKGDYSCDARAEEFFAKHENLDYFIYSDKAPTKNHVIFVQQSRIGYYRPGKTYPTKHSWQKWGRPPQFRFVTLKEPILSNFDEKLEKPKRKRY